MTSCRAAALIFSASPAICTTSRDEELEMFSSAGNPLKPSFVVLRLGRHPFPSDLVLASLSARSFFLSRENQAVAFKSEIADLL